MANNNVLENAFRAFFKYYHHNICYCVDHIFHMMNKYSSIDQKIMNVAYFVMEENNYIELKKQFEKQLLLR